MLGAEVEGFEGVERGVMGLLRLWKCVENGFQSQGLDANANTDENILGRVLRPR